MGIKINRIGPRDFILPTDEAVIGGYEEYVKSYYDRSKLQLREDIAPTVFRIQPLTRTQEMTAAGFSDRVQAEQIVRCCLTAVDNLTVVDEEGHERPAEPVKRETVGNFGLLVTDDWLDKHRLGDLVNDIAAAGWRITVPDPT